MYESSTPINRQENIMLIGPLPPPSGGARISFELFLTYLKGYDSISFSHYDLPVRKNREHNPPGSVSHLRTLLRVIACLLAIPKAQSVVVFGSRNFCFTYGLVIIFWSKIFRKNCFVRFFGGRPMEALVRVPEFLRKSLCKSLSLADRIIIQTEVGVSEFPDYLRKKMDVVTGYRTRLASKVNSTRRKDKNVRFVYAGTINELKGALVLIEAFLKLQQLLAQEDFAVELHLYGNASKEMTHQMQDIKGVFYHGPVDNSTLIENLVSHDVFVFPSKAHWEGHPGVLIEALMCGLPVIASDLPGPREVLGKEFHPFMFEVGNVMQLTTAMERISKDALLRHRLSNEALAISRRFDAELVIPRLASTLGITIPDG